MKIQTIPAPIFIRAADNHATIKPQILNAIAEAQALPVRDNNQQISSSDWCVSNSTPKHYWDIAFPAIAEHLKSVGINMGLNDATVLNYWFQQYKPTDYHNLHVHESCMFSNVYFVELPENTETIFSLLGKNYSFDVKEGDIITFPSFLPHLSPQNNTLKSKTVIAFNVNYSRIDVRGQHEASG